MTPIVGLKPYTFEWRKAGIARQDQHCESGGRQRGDTYGKSSSAQTSRNGTCGKRGCRGEQVRIDDVVKQTELRPVLDR
jgi:hypothetical protein